MGCRRLAPRPRPWAVCATAVHDKSHSPAKLAVVKYYHNAKSECDCAMMRKISLILLGAVAGAGLTLLATQPLTVLVRSSAKAASSDTYRQLNLFGEVFERVRANYAEKPDNSKLVEAAINGMLTGLDPHSSYMDPKSFREIQVETRGECSGPGSLNRFSASLSGVSAGVRLPCGWAAG